MLPRELILKIRKLEIKTNRVVNSEVAGGYHSIFKGQGIEFEEVRPYFFGDDVRAIDWNVSARMQAPFVKRFREERELFVWLLVDVSGSTFFATAGKPKSEIAAELSAVIAFSAIKNNDRVGLIFFSDHVEKYIAPKKGRKHVLRLITEILGFKPSDSKTNISAAFDFLGKIAKRRSVVFVLSDFFADNFSRSLAVFSKKHQVIPLVLHDRRELELPDVGLVTFKDAETGKLITLDTSLKRVKREYAKLNAERTQNLTHLFDRLGIDAINISTNADYTNILVNYFRSRAKHKRLR